MTNRISNLERELEKKTLQLFKKYEKLHKEHEKEIKYIG